LAQLMSVLSSIHEAVVTDMPVTKRDIYYQDINLFRTQSTVDRLVDDIGATFEVSRAQLNVRASPKGLFLGSGLTMHLVSGLPITGNDSEATIVPQNEDISRCVVDSDVRWVLILEKEASSRCTLGGKGYPDVATRKLVNQLANDLPTNVPILALVDWDPHGIDILLTYKLGSISMLHEKDTLAASRVQWLGIYSSDVLK
ncbi:DNA topoisomerase IV alpha subunit, partial [Punctularia strigosozonata HHB-11173 SS5]|uniref:DNA topoisomerase IV alpha subunit n=1 Tax=Punctularia strigosozonata (strain HHB-11173) TaxID=741275 RepID=UPI0004416839